MHTVAMVMNDVLVGTPTGEAADRKGPVGREDEERRQRFADMLPLRASKDEMRPDNNDAEQVSTANTRTAVDADQPKGRSAQDDEETPAVGVDLAGGDAPGRVVPGPEGARADAGKGTLSRTEQSEVPHRQTPVSNRISTESQVTSGKELTASRAGVSAAPAAAYQVKGPARASGATAETGRPVESESPKVPGRAAQVTVRGAETTAQPVAKGPSDSVPGPQAPITNVKDAGLGAPVLSGGTKEAPPKGPKDGLMVRPEAAPASTSETGTSSPRLSIPAQGAAAGAASGSPARDIGEQILDSMRASLARGDKQITIRLRPPELGTVLVRFREDGKHITGLLEVGKSDIRHEVEQALPQVLRSLHDAGVHVRRFEVVTSDQGQRDFARDQMHQGTWSQQYGSGENHNPLPGSGQTWRSQDDASHPAGSHEESNIHHQGVVAPGRIDMLL